MLQANFYKKMPMYDLNVNFQITNEVLVIYGPSGAGKSTILHCIAGIVTPEKGLIKFGEKIFYSHKQGLQLPVRKRGIGFVFQEFALFPHLSVKENILYGMRRKGKTTVDFDEIIDFLRIRPLLTSYPGSISGGEKQRVALARALVSAPDLLLMDEPMSALDWDLRKTIQRELKQMQKRWQIPMIVVTHDLQEGEYLADKMLLLEKGQQIWGRLA
ncbi:molybdate transport system ATP-binding protein [Carboxydocella thermautotrophica]|nr:molybdate transport system ATP-binding protein [Carboxydocella thermautotrophica]